MLQEDDYGVEEDSEPGLGCGFGGPVQPAPIRKVAPAALSVAAGLPLRIGWGLRPQGAQFSPRPFAKSRLRRSPSLRDYLCSLMGAPSAA